MRSSLSLSLIFHILLLALLLLFGDQARKSVSRPTEWIQIETPPLAKRQTPPPKKEDDTHQQIVQTDRGQEVKTPVPDSYLGERNQEVDRQTVSREHRITMGQTKDAKPVVEPQPDKSPPQTAKNQAHSPSEKTSESKSQSSKPGEDKNPRPEDMKLSNLGAPILPSARFGANGAPKEWEDAHRWAELGSGPEDYVKGLNESDHTALNTKEYVFYGYFQRIRERLDRAWIPVLRDRLTKMYRMGRSLASDMDHITQVMVVLNPQGEIVHVRIVGESGTRDLDDAAVRAFNLAGPFPNPPKGIIDPNGEIKIPWQFILKT